MNEPMFTIIQEEKKGNYAKFIISPLEQGYGLTLGNSLRRVLLISLPGLAITKVKIAAVKHQFSTLKGMKEDVVEFLLNLKKVRFSGSLDKPTRATISVKGSGEVRAKDIKVSGRIEVVNEELVLATLSKDAKLEAEMEIEAGVGYSPASERGSQSLGTVPLDASFSPVSRVNYSVSETRVGRLTNYDKLTMEIWTDGAVPPKDALYEAAKILVSYFSQIVSPRKVAKEETVKVDSFGAVGKLSIEEIGVPTRVANALARAGYETVEQLTSASREDLAKVRNLGEKSLKIISAALGQKGVKFSWE